MLVTVEQKQIKPIKKSLNLFQLSSADIFHSVCRTPYSSPVE